MFLQVNLCNSSNSTPVYSCWERREAARWTAGTEANNDVVGDPPEVDPPANVAAEEAADLDVAGEATAKEVLDRQNVRDTNDQASWSWFCAWDPNVEAEMCLPKGGKIDLFEEFPRCEEQSKRLLCLMGAVKQGSWQTKSKLFGYYCAC